MEGKEQKCAVVAILDKKVQNSQGDCDLVECSYTNSEFPYRGHEGTGSNGAYSWRHRIFGFANEDARVSDA